MSVALELQWSAPGSALSRRADIRTNGIVPPRTSLTKPSIVICKLWLVFLRLMVLFIKQRLQAVLMALLQKVSNMFAAFVY